MPISANENIVRAICSDKWDGERVAPSLFKGENTSVSRLALIPLADHWEMFRRHVERPPQRELKRLGEINVGVLAELGASHNPPVHLTVEEKPEPWNPAHAEIPQRITRGLANRIVAALTLHRDAGNQPRTRAH